MAVTSCKKRSCNLNFSLLYLLYVCKRGSGAWDWPKMGWVLVCFWNVLSFTLEHFQVQKTPAVCFVYAWRANHSWVRFDDMRRCFRLSATVCNGSLPCFVFDWTTVTAVYDWVYKKIATSNQPKSLQFEIE